MVQGRPVAKMAKIFLSDEELGKKNDDHDPYSTRHTLRLDFWHRARASSRRMFKRIVILVTVAVAVYFFIKNLPTDNPIRDRRHPVYIHPDDVKAAVPPGASRPEPPRKVDSPEVAAVKRPVQPYAAEPIKFPELSESLHAIASTRGGSSANRNVLFAAAGVRSAANLLPVACQAGIEARNYVHFVLLGRSDIEPEELRQINGIDQSCQVMFHDARPDYASTSTQTRLESSIYKAISQVNSLMHPQAIIVDGSENEESFFLRAMRAATSELNVAMIELPENGLASVPWITKLDSASLSAWNKVNIEILIHAAPGASGSLIRLLKSLGHADLTAFSVPHLTIELPPTIDPPAQSFLKRFEWPPAFSANAQRHMGDRQHVSFRHRIPRAKLNEEESSVRFLESFWPVDARYSHVLVLSPQAELSPAFLHYLKYTLLEYMYSRPSASQEWASKFMGISLDLPSAYLNGTPSFSPPTNADRSTAEAKPNSGPAAAAADPSLFLWQAPNSNAMLFTSEKWMELHGFVSHAISISGVSDQEKQVSKSYPSWLEHALRLARARGYFVLYPSARTAANLATIHNDLFQPPEEYGDSPSSSSSVLPTEVSPKHGPLLYSLPGGGRLPALADLPILTWDGELVDRPTLDDSAAAYAADFRKTLGGCKTLGAAVEVVPHPLARDLFCERHG